MESKEIVALIVNVRMIEFVIDIRRIVQHLVVRHEPHAAGGKIVVETLAEQLAVRHEYLHVGGGVTIVVQLLYDGCSTAVGRDEECATVWGFIDIVSCGPLTMDKRYGVIYVDLDNDGNGTGERIRKDSFHWYKHFIETQGEEL